MINAYGEFYEDIQPRKTPVANTGVYISCTHLRSGIVGQWAPLTQDNLWGAFLGSGNIMITAKVDEFWFHGRKMTSEQEIELMLAEVPVFGKPDQLELRRRDFKLARTAWTEIHEKRANTSLTSDENSL